ncbi:SLC15A4 [Branchiostoma lanceolatum]|uniref:SLC15A4 protein n=1 Tax=Branchiostoma lanceolatum TaxID=7740 RepID=A0A8J9YUM0_BRALA|nr:SLC15A4 [Branchiostoma lanceolatum]
MRREPSDVAGEAGNRKVWPWRSSCLLICLSELLERVTYYGILANMADYLTSPCFPQRYHQPLTISWIFMAVAYVLTFIGGWLADIFNRSWIIIISLGIYFVGTVLLTVSSHLCGQSPDDRVSGLYVAGLTLVAIGTGGSKSNLGLFGAQQYKTSDEKVKTKLQSFFHWYYLSINVGGTIAVLGVARLYIIDPVHGNVVVLVSVFLSGVVFVIGRIGNLYDLQQDSPHKLLRRTAARLFHSDTSEQQMASQQRKSNTWQLMLIFATLIPYYAIYSQTQTTYLFQSERLRMPLWCEGSYITAINSVTIILMIPFMVIIVYPRLTANGVKLAPMTLMGVGILLSVLSVLAAGLVEAVRRPLVKNGQFVDQLVRNQTVRAADLTVLVQVPQLFLSGISEVLTLTVGYYFAYTEAPPGRKGTIMGAYLLVWGLGSAVSLGLRELVDTICAGRNQSPTAGRERQQCATNHRQLGVNDSKAKPTTDQPTTVRRNQGRANNSRSINRAFRTPYDHLTIRSLIHCSKRCVDLHPSGAEEKARKAPTPSVRDSDSGLKELRDTKDRRMEEGWSSQTGRPIRRTSYMEAVQTVCLNNMASAASVMKEISEKNKKLQRDLLDVSDEAYKLIQHLDGIDDVKSEVEKRIKVLEFQRELDNIRHQLKSGHFPILVAGEISAGKSSLLNLLLGEDVLPQSLLSTTHVICELKRGTRKHVVVHPLDGDDDIQFDLEGIFLVDSPGVGEQLERITFEYLSEACAFIYVIDTAHAGGVQDDRVLKIIRKVTREKPSSGFHPKSAIFVFNKWDQVPEGEEEEVKEHMTQRLQENWPELDPTSQVFFMSVKKAAACQKSGEGPSEDFSKLLEGIRCLLPEGLVSKVKNNYGSLDSLLSGIFSYLRERLEATKKDKDEKMSDIQIVRQRRDKVQERVYEEMNTLRSFEDDLKKVKESILTTVDDATPAAQPADDRPLSETLTEERPLFRRQTSMLGLAGVMIMTAPVWAALSSAAVAISLPVMGLDAAQTSIEKKRLINQFNDNPAVYMFECVKKFLKTLTKDSVRKFLSEELKTLKMHMELKNKLISIMEADKKMLEDLERDERSASAIIQEYQPLALEYQALISFADIFRARLRRKNDVIPVALKVIKTPLFENNASDVVREAEILRSLDHCNVLKLIGCFLLTNPDGDTRYVLVTELCSGNLRDYVRKNSAKIPGKQERYSPQQGEAMEHVTGIAIQVVKGLKYIHNKEYLHRDLKMENILISEGDVVKLCDVGLAKAEDDVTGTQCGTYMYMAPEVYAVSRHKYTRKADIFSLGLMLWELWYGEIIYKGTPLPLQEFIKEVADGRRPAFPEGAEPIYFWRNLMQECWDGEPARRPPADRCLTVLLCNDACSSAIHFKIDKGSTL